MRNEPTWAYESVFYQIYPLGLCGAPFENDGVFSSRILKVIGWIPHLKRLGINAVYFGPIFESDTHGYNTRDYLKVDTRLGTNEDFALVCSKLHEAGIKVVLDGVFNHVGRGFWAFKDVQHNREHSPYVNWFSRIDFNGDSPDHDGFWYEGWEGNYDLVKLNLHNPDVVSHLFYAIDQWIDQFDIDGLRLDVAYCLDKGFLNKLREHCDQKKDSFFLVGEVLHGEYGRMLKEMNIHSVTNYQCYKGLYSAFNSDNMFEIMHSLMRLFGPEDWTVCRGAHLLSFADNHDVTRLASILKNEKHLLLVYSLLFTMPGIPCIYYGSEWGTKADKSQGDPALRPAFDEPVWNELAEFISRLAEIKKNSNALNYGSLRMILLNSTGCLFERRTDSERYLIAINTAAQPWTARFDAGCEKGHEMLSGYDWWFHGELEFPPYSAFIWKMER